MNKLVKFLTVLVVSVLTISFHTFAQTVQDGLKNLDAERYNAAGTIFNQLIASTPSAENYFYQGYYYLNLPEPQLTNAKDAFTKGLALDAKRPDAFCRIGLATVKLLSGDKAGAAADFAQIKKDTKNKNADVFYRIGEAYSLSETNNDPAEAAMNIQAGLDLQKAKNNPNYYIALANAYLLKNDGGPAMTALENALAMGQNVAKIRTLMGRVWYQGKNYEKAKKELDEAIKADPEYAPAYRITSSLWQTYQKYDLAAKFADQYLQKSEPSVDAKLRYVKLAFTSKNYEGALNTLNSIFDEIKDPIKYRLKGYILTERATDCDLAVELIQNWLKNAGKDSEGKDRILPMDYGYLGRAYACSKGDNKMLSDSLAIINMTAAIEKGDTTYNYTPDMVKIYTDQKRFDKVAGVYKTVVEKSKKPNTTDWFNLAGALYRTKDYVGADAAYAKLNELTPNYEPAYLQRGYCQQFSDPTRVDSAGKAEPFFLKYIDLMSKKGNDKFTASEKKNMVYVYGYLALRNLNFLKDLTKASDYAKKMLELDPNDSRAQQILGASSGTPTTVPPTTTPATNNSSGTGGNGNQPKN
jgi:tetratricopeptide (TPR) repeat protein